MNNELNEIEKKFVEDITNNSIDISSIDQLLNSDFKDVCKNCDINKLEQIRVTYLGKQGQVTKALKSLNNLSIEQRPIIGKQVNKVRDNIEKCIDILKSKLYNLQIEKELETDVIDITLPGKRNHIGTFHPIDKAIKDITNIFMGMGYSVAEGPEIELTKYNFDALNTPFDHPSRDLQDSFYITDNMVLRTQTSPVQVRSMEKSKPPIKVICPGRVYRSDDIDATHSAMFTQIEGLVVDKNITMANLKDTLSNFAKEMFGEDTKIRLRPHYFPFTEPSAEVDVSCFVCKGEGCRVCKGEGWIEILGCGMVHPNVLRAGGIDPDEYSGFAFGMGADRVAMIKYNINDMRYLFENDVRFLKQFK